MFKRIIILALVSAFTAPASASADLDLEKVLATALRLKKGTTGRLGEPREAIEAYISKGVISKKPEMRADYTDYYVVKTPASFIGHDLLIIKEEYMSTYVGCCVNPGLVIVVKVNGNPKSLHKFADTNKCFMEDNIDVQKELRGLSIKTTVPKGRYASLSCREMDANQ